MSGCTYVSEEECGTGIEITYNWSVSAVVSNERASNLNQFVTSNHKIRLSMLKATLGYHDIPS
jgi:hypothetical protein